MTESASGFTVEQRVEAPREAVWRALTEPAELERWFGWEAPGLRDEIRFIFVEHARPRPPGRIEMDGGHAIELEEEDGATVVRAVQAGGDADDATYDGMREGWRAFFTQLVHLLERAPGQDRRTLYLTGEGSPRAAAAALRARCGDEAGACTFQLAAVLPAPGGEPPSGLLAILDAREPLDADGPARMTLTLTAHGAGEASWTALADDWRGWWLGLVDAGAVEG